LTNASDFVLPRRLLGLYENYTICIAFRKSLHF